MIVVSDSSAFVCLVRIGQGDVLPTLFKQIVIPPEVASELASPNRPQSVQDFIAAPPSWLEIRAATSVEPRTFMPVRLRRSLWRRSFRQTGFSSTKSVGARRPPSGTCP